MTSRTRHLQWESLRGSHRYDLLYTVVNAFVFFTSDRTVTRTPPTSKGILILRVRTANEKNEDKKKEEYIHKSHTLFNLA